MGFSKLNEGHLGCRYAEQLWYLTRFDTCSWSFGDSQKGMPSGGPFTNCWCCFGLCLGCTEPITALKRGPLDLVWNMPCEPSLSAWRKRPQLAPKMVPLQCLLLRAQNRLIRRILEGLTTTNQTIETDDFSSDSGESDDLGKTIFFQGKNNLKDEKSCENNFGRSGYVSGNLWNLDIPTVATIPGPMGSFTRHVTTMLSPTNPSYVTTRQWPVPSVTQLRTDPTFENKFAAHQAYLDKLQFGQNTL